MSLSPSHNPVLSINYPVFKHLYSTSNGNTVFCAQEEAVVDVATMLFGTAAHLLNNEAAIRCFRSTAAALRPGGLFVLELPSPEDLFDGVFALGDVWDAAAPNGQKLLVEYGLEGDEFDFITQVTHISWSNPDCVSCLWILEVRTEI